MKKKVQDFKYVFIRQRNHPLRRDPGMDVHCMSVLSENVRQLVKEYDHIVSSFQRCHDLFDVVHSEAIFHEHLFN